jgi:murein DD-endopeptidase MepM/ murein hydrolase activator NlpD
MTDRHKNFPLSGPLAGPLSGSLPGRAAVVAAILALVSVVTSVAAAAPSKEDVERAKERLERIDAALARIQGRLVDVQLELEAKTAEVEENEVLLERIQTELGQTRAKLDRAEARYDVISERLNERAVEAYMQGPASSIDFVLGAETVSELTDRLAYADALAQADAELAVQVANLRNELTVAKAALEAKRLEQARHLSKVREDKERVLAIFDEIRQLQADQQDLFGQAERVYKDRKRAYQRYLDQHQQSMGGRAWTGGPLPEPFDHVIDSCPVDQPRGFGDGFGAPRYAGGYHLHKGVDIVAPYGTAIRAAFDGYSYTSSNSLGGNVVFVVGRYGRVYNAHLQSYSSQSNGAVSAGDVIGYVGDTGDATGIPHDHFEFHPNVMPGPWPVSYYGYSKIEDAINPYPLLIQACG